MKPADHHVLDEVDTDVVTHWGCHLPSGIIRWDPGYGSGVNVPYTEAEARADVAASPGSTLVTRTWTTVTTITHWTEVKDA